MFLDDIGMGVSQILNVGDFGLVVVIDFDKFVHEEFDLVFEYLNVFVDIVLGEIKQFSLVLVHLNQLTDFLIFLTTILH